MKSRLTNAAPALRIRPTGGFGAQQWTPAGAPTRARTADSRCSATHPSGRGSMLNPLAVGMCPASTAGSDGSSNATMTLRPGTRRAHDRRRGPPPVGQRLRDVTHRTRVGQRLVAAGQLERAASVHGPATCTFNGPT